MARRRGGGVGWLIVLGVLWGVGSLFNQGSPPPHDSINADQQPAAPLFSAPTAGRDAAVQQPRKQIFYVTATTLNVRAQPDAGSAILLAAPRGTSVVGVSRSADWIEVELTNGSTGWMSAQYLSSAKPEAPARVVADPPKKPAPDRNAIVQALIAESISSYPGNCPCPYNTDRAGRSCGKRSAWSKAGGYSPLCYPGDVTAAMIEKYLARSR